MKSGQLWNTIRGRGWMGGWVVEYLEIVRENCLKVMKFLSRMFEIFDVCFTKLIQCILFCIFVLKCERSTILFGMLLI